MFEVVHSRWLILATHCSSSSCEWSPFELMAVHLGPKVLTRWYAQLMTAAVSTWARLKTNNIRSSGCVGWMTRRGKEVWRGKGSRCSWVSPCRLILRCRQHTSRILKRKMCILQVSTASQPTYSMQGNYALSSAESISTLMYAAHSLAVG